MKNNTYIENLKYYLLGVTQVNPYAVIEREMLYSILKLDITDDGDKKKFRQTISRMRYKAEAEEKSLTLNKRFDGTKWSYESLLKGANMRLSFFLIHDGYDGYFQPDWEHRVQWLNKWYTRDTTRSNTKRVSIGACNGEIAQTLPVIEAKEYMKNILLLEG